MIERYVDIDFDNRISYEAEGGFDNEHDATIIRLKVIDENAKYYLDLGLFSGGFSKYRTEALPIENGYATYRLPRDLTHGHLHVQGVMKIGDICRKTATITMRLGGSINALDELPESHPSWADGVDKSIGDLTALKTTDKSSLVGAINEAMNNGISEEKLAMIINNYLEEHPIDESVIRF